MKILLTGATGFVGRHLIEALLKEGHELVALTRNVESAQKKLPPKVKPYRWNPEKERAPVEAFSQVEAVIHLAGEGVAEKRWSNEQKRKIYDSRVLGTRHLMDTIANLSGNKIKTVVAASAIGIYGYRGDEAITENSPHGTHFLADVCEDWEKALTDKAPAGLRTVSLRIGIVLGTDGGVLKRVLPLFKLGAGGKLGNGRQYMSWVHIDDIVGLFLHALKQPTMKGPVNATAPDPVTNTEFTKALGRALSRPTFLPAPAFALKLALGELSDLILGSQRVIPKRAIDSGYAFKFRDVDGALEDLIKKKAPGALKPSMSSSGSPSR